VREPSGVASAALAAVGSDTGLFHSGPSGGVDRLVTALSGRTALLVLDNCEHQLDACAALVEKVLAGCPGVRVLLTTREPLGITGETLVPLGPLAVPDPESRVDTANPSMRLFTERAAAVRPGFALTDANLPAVVEICRRLDGLPLAIELACARLRSMDVEEIAARLGDRFRLLTGLSRGRPSLVAVSQLYQAEAARAAGDRATAMRLLTDALHRIENVTGALPPRLRVLCTLGLAQSDDPRQQAQR
jgi:predicted ATPase